MRITVEWREEGKLYRDHARTFGTWDGLAAFKFYPLGRDMLQCKISEDNYISCNGREVGKMEYRNRGKVTGHVAVLENWLDAY